MSPPRLLILGNSAAAVSAISAIRARGCDWPITLVSREACDAYSPVLTTYYLRGAIEEAGLFVCDASFYLQGEVRRLFGCAVVGLDTATQRVTLDDGTTIAYDLLLIATGASPKRLTQVDPETAADICYLRTIEDARRIRQLAARAAHIAVVGGGLVSLQVATAVARPDLRVTALVTSRQLLSQNVDAPCAALLQHHAERQSTISFLFGRTPTAISRCGGGYKLILDTGEELIADMVVAGKGVTPNTDYLTPGQIATEQGILVNEQLRTSVPGVFAAGDLAQGRNRLTGACELVPNWINACEQGRLAGANLVGADERFEGSVPENITTVFGLPVASIGVTRIPRDDPGWREVTYAQPERNLYRKLVFEHDRPRGALLVGDIEDAGVLRSAIVRGSELPGPEPEIARAGLTQARQLKRCLDGQGG